MPVNYFLDFCYAIKNIIRYDKHILTDLHTVCGYISANFLKRHSKSSCLLSFTLGEKI